MYNQYKDTVYKIIGAAMSVHSELNWGLLEPIYQEALHLELEDRGIKNEREQEINCYYKHHLLDKKYKMDIVVDDIVVELPKTDDIHPPKTGISVHFSDFFHPNGDAKLLIFSDSGHF